ncbi:MAG: hypothetical protein II424_03875 [Bacteroidales bacterium]|nr:hypothetical protein [Bacteroidales bacterium]
MPGVNVIPDLFGNPRQPRLDRESTSVPWQGARRAPWGRSSPQRPAAGGRIFRRRCHFAKLLHNDRPSTALQCGSLCAMG